MSESEESEWCGAPAREGVPSHEVYTPTIQQSPQDERRYQAIRLKNGFRALLIHDPDVDKSSASLNVAVGHLSDPEDIPGLAHFCEHLLFMGTEKYPKENEYKEYLSKNGGGSNASTAAHRTNYYFYVNAEALSGALDRFSGFFSCPLFLESCTTREINAVDSENKKNLQDDDRRHFQLTKHLSKPGHIWRKFGTGNKETLTVPPPTGSEDGTTPEAETRRRVMEWWKTEYCASRMTLAIIGRESLDELAKMTATLFSAIAEQSQKPPLYVDDHPYGPNELKIFTFMKTIKDQRQLKITFPIAWQPPFWTVKPASFVSHFVGHEGPGSLHAYLRKKGWVDDLSAGSNQLATGIATFNVTVTLTVDGLKHYREVLLALYKYLSLLRSSPPEAWVQQEIQALSDIYFRFKEKGSPQNYTNWIAEQLHSPLPLSLVLSGSILTWSWDQDLVTSTLEALDVYRSRVIVQARGEELEKVREGLRSKWQKEKWFGTEHVVEDMEDGFVRQACAENDITDFFLPGVNEYIPTEFEVNKHEVSRPRKHPDLLQENDMISLWHKKDDQFWVPKGRIVLEIRTPKASNTARSSVKTRLFAELVVDSLNESTYAASLAGLNYSLSTHAFGFSVSFGGYNHKLPLLVRTVLERMKNLQVDAERLRIIKERVERGYRNFFLGQSHSIAGYYLGYLLTERQWTLSEKLGEIESITKEDIETHALALLSRVHVVALVHGNMTDETARIVSTLAESILESTPIPPKEREREHSLLLPESCNYIYRLPVPNPNQQNSALTYYLHIGDIGIPKQRTTARLLAQMLKEPAFDTLRTKEQLGYIVSLTSEPGTSSIGIRIRVQSERDPAYLEERVEAFLTKMDGVLGGIDEAEFEGYKRGLRDKWLEKLKNLGEECNRFWTHIDSGYLDFQRAENDAKLLDDVLKEDILAMFHLRLLPGSHERSKLSVHLYVDKTEPEPNDPATASRLAPASDAVINDIGRAAPLALTERLKGATYIQDAKAFRASLKVSEPARPVKVFHPVPGPKL